MGSTHFSSETLFRPHLCRLCRHDGPVNLSGEWDFYWGKIFIKDNAIKYQSRALGNSNVCLWPEMSVS